MEKMEPPPPYSEVDPKLPTKMDDDECEMSSEKTKEVVIFEDEWSKVDEQGLTIKWFYFPTTQAKKIKFAKIKGVYYERQNMGLNFRCKGWGSSLSPCWWACDMRRNIRNKDNVHYNIVVDTGEASYKGFTTKDANEFLKLIRPRLGSAAVVQNQLPF